jgi:hypothetical protein
MLRGGNDTRQSNYVANFGKKKEVKLAEHLSDYYGATTVKSAGELPAGNGDPATGDSAPVLPSIV